MTDTDLAWLSTIAGLIVTAALFVVLARWSAGEGSWGSLPGIVRGLHDWTSNQAQETVRVPSPSSPVAEIAEL